MLLFESVPNFSEGRRQEVISALFRSVRTARFLDLDADPDHNRVVISIAGSRERLIDALLATTAEAVARIDLRDHHGVHPRVGAADVIPIIPLGESTLDASREVAHELAERIWGELKVPVFFYGHGEGGRRLADIRGGRVKPDLGDGRHPTAGAVSVGAREPLVAFNVILLDTDLEAARALARTLRESASGMRGVQALAFELPGGRVQLSMNLFRLDETTPAHLMAELERRGVPTGPQSVVGLCPAAAANRAAAGRVLEGRLAATAGGLAAQRCDAIGDAEHRALAIRFRQASGGLLHFDVDQDVLLAAAEQSAALIPVARAAGVIDDEIETLLNIAARGLRSAISEATAAVYGARVAALDARLV